MQVELPRSFHAKSPNPCPLLFERLACGRLAKHLSSRDRHAFLNECAHVRHKCRQSVWIYHACSAKAGEGPHCFQTACDAINPPPLPQGQTLSRTRSLGKEDRRIQERFL